MTNNDRKYSNDLITVFWVPSKCSHSTICYRELLEVFDPRKRPWVNMQGASTERIIEVVNQCPTGALSWRYNKDLTIPVTTSEYNDNEEITPEDVYKRNKTEEKQGAKILLLKNGPLLAEGEFRIIGTSGEEIKSTGITAFCRCGHSGAQPFCDGTHQKAGFKD